MDRDEYLDPENWEGILHEIKIAQKEEEEITEYISRFYPKWIVGSTNDYCNDYPYLKHTWNVICERNGVNRQKIVLVDKVFFDKKDQVSHNLIMGLCEVFTRKGYVIRRKEEFIGCEKCGKAIPVQELWVLMKEKGMPVPIAWNIKCTEC